MRGRHARGELINERAGKATRIPLRGRVFEAADGRLRGKRRARLRAPPDRHLQRRIVAQQVVIDGVFPAAADAEYARGHNLGEAMPDAGWIAPVRQCRRQPRDDAGLLLRRPQQQYARIRRLVTAVEINCELLARDGWQIEGHWCYIGHGGCGVPLRRMHARFDNGLLRAFNALRHSRHRNLHL